MSYRSLLSYIDIPYFLMNFFNVSLIQYLVKN